MGPTQRAHIDQYRRRARRRRTTCPTTAACSMARCLAPRLAAAMSTDGDPAVHASPRAINGSWPHTLRQRWLPRRRLRWRALDGAQPHAVARAPPSPRAFDGAWPHTGRQRWQPVRWLAAWLPSGGGDGCSGTPRHAPTMALSPALGGSGSLHRRPPRFATRLADGDPAVPAGWPPVVVDLDSASRGEHDAALGSRAAPHPSYEPIGIVERAPIAAPVEGSMPRRGGRDGRSAALGKPDGPG